MSVRGIARKNFSKNRYIITVAAAAGASLLAVACSSAPASSTPPASTASAAATASAASGQPASAALKTEKSSLGTVLANSAGLTVYWFSADHGTTSACTGSCAAAWPPVIGAPKAASGVTLSGTLGTITRSGGQKQATYNGHPLYTFKIDTAPGQVSGNGVVAFGGKGYAITLGGAVAPASPTASSSGGYGGY